MPRSVLTTVAIGVLLALHGSAVEPLPDVIATTVARRTSYLAHATIWREPGPLTPADVRRGSSLSASPADSDGVHCAFVTRGNAVGGHSPKFLCRGDDGRLLRVKYWDLEQEAGNREVFATVVATRLLWALGFDAEHGRPVDLSCDGCPENPESGEGEPRARRYAALLTSPPVGALILSGADHDQGWAWRELDRAIAGLPAGDDRATQRTHFDALTLLGVFMQHGDRKPQQQTLYCGELAEMPGAARTLVDHDGPVACTRAVVRIADVGATFGGAGRLSRPSTAKMNVKAWRKKAIFVDGERTVCRGNLTVSLAAGDEGAPDPLVSEEGRLFLLAQLRRLTSDHVRALFEAARVDRLKRGHQTAAADRDGDIDAWVAAFEDKVRQIEERTCPPAFPPSTESSTASRTRKP